MKKFIIPIILVIIIVGIGVCFYLYQFTEVFGKKILPPSISSISIQYTPGLALDDALALNTQEKEVIKPITLSLNKDEVNYLEKSFRNVKKISKAGKDLKKQYEITINKNITISVYEDGALVERGKTKTSIKIPTEALGIIADAVEIHNEEVVKKLSFEKIILKYQGSSITVTEEENLRYLKEYLTYYPVTLEGDYKTYHNGYDMEIILDDTTRIYLYSSNLSYISLKEGEKDVSTYAFISHDLYHLVQQIFDISTK